MIPRSMWKTSPRRIRILKIWIVIMAINSLLLLAAEDWAWLVFNTAMLVFMMFDLRKSRRVLAETFERRALKKELSELARTACGHESSWSRQTDRGLMAISIENKRRLNVCRATMDSLNEGYNSIDHSSEVVIEIIRIQPRFADALRLFGVIQLEETSVGTFTVTSDRVQIEIRPSDLRSELVVATEDELQSMIDDLKYAQAYLS